MASLRGPTDSPPKFMSASACSPNHNHRHNKFKGSFIWHRHFSMLPLHGTEGTGLLLFGKTLSWFSQIFCSLENTNIKEKKTRKPIYWLNSLRARSIATCFHQQFLASISSVHSKPNSEIYTQYHQYGMVSHSKVQMAPANSQARVSVVHYTSFHLDL